MLVIPEILSYYLSLVYALSGICSLFNHLEQILVDEKYYILCSFLGMRIQTCVLNFAHTEIALLGTVSLFNHLEQILVDVKYYMLFSWDANTNMCVKFCSHRNCASRHSISSIYHISNCSLLLYIIILPIPVIILPHRLHIFFSVGRFYTE